MATQTTATLATNFGKNVDTSTTGPSGSGDLCTDSISEATAAHGITINHDLTLGANVDITFGTGVLTLGSVAGSGGFALPSTSTVFHSGGVGPVAATTGTEATAATTESYVVEVLIPNNSTITGVAILNASAVAGNIQISLADSTGAIIAAAQTASTAASGTAAYQKVAFAAPYAATAGRYFIVLQANNTGYKFRAHALGNFRAGKLTGGTYGTFTTVASITSFTADLGPICDTY